jgi:hypothetical protein
MKKLRRHWKKVMLKCVAITPPQTFKLHQSPLFFQLLEAIEQILEAKGTLDDRSSFTLKRDVYILR